MRLFVGIGLPSSLAEGLSRAARALAPGERGRVRWTPPGNMHLTISFLGQVEPARLGCIEQALAELQSPPLHLKLEGGGIFPDAGILYAQVRPSAALLNCAEQIFRAMEACGFPREQRPYTPHITLARIKGRIHLSTHAQSNSAFHGRFEAHEFRLYESVTLPEGAQYKVLHAFPLQTRAPHHQV